MQVISELKNITRTAKVWKIRKGFGTYKVILPYSILNNLKQHINMIHSLLQAGYTNIEEYEDVVDNKTFLICEKCTSKDKQAKNRSLPNQ